MSEVLSPLSVLSPKDRDTLIQRSQTILRRARNEGAAIFVLSAICIFVTALLWRNYEARSQSFEASIPLGFKQIFLRPQEQRDNIEYPGILAVALSPEAAAHPPEICDRRESEECRIGKQILSTTEMLVQIADEVRAPTGPSHECGEGVSSQGRGDQLLEILETWNLHQDVGEKCAWMRKASKLLDSATHPPTAMKIAQCKELPKSKEPVGVGIAGCISGENRHISTLIPAQLYEDRTEEPYKKTQTIDYLPQYRSNVRAAIGWGNLLDLAVELTENQRHLSEAKHNSAHEVRITQAYFISPDNLLHIWTPGVLDPQAAFPRARQWAAASYFRHFVETGSTTPYYTKPYLDFGGYGVVRTECRPLKRSSPYSVELLGIVCVDFAIPMLENRQIVNEWTGQPFLRVGVVQVQLQGSTYEVKSAKFLDSSSARDNSRLLDAVQELVTRESIDRIVQSPDQLTFDGNKGFLVPIEESEDGRLSFLTAFPRDPREVDKSRGLLWCSLAGGALWLFLTVGNGIGAYRDRLTRTRIALFRSLQAGVIETSGDQHQIIRANDRAEELLRRKLPKELTTQEGRLRSLVPWKRAAELTGTSAESGYESTYRYWDLIEIAFRLKKDGLYGSQSDGTDNEAADPKDYEPIGETAITKDRTAGVTTRYWIALVSSKQSENQKGNRTQPELRREWLQVVAGPYVPMDGWEGSGDSAGPKLMSYGFIQPAGEVRAKQLEKAYEHEKLSDQLRRGAS